jgi:hypothetical protein
MIQYDSTQTLRLVVTGAGSIINLLANFTDVTAAGYGLVAPLVNENLIAGTHTAGLAPAASTVRILKNLIVHNSSTSVTSKVEFGVLDPAWFFEAITVNLAPNETLLYDENGLKVLTATGLQKTVDSSAVVEEGSSRGLYKVGTAPEAAGTLYWFSKDAGVPSAWAVGTSGINGRVTDGNAAADNGCFGFAPPPTGAMYLRDANVASSVAALLQLWDVLWVNNGLVVTTTTAQTITQPTLPARDVNGTTNGEGINAAILVTTATTNASAITNMTLSYTNSDGVAGRTATVASFAATAVAGYIAQFRLAAGDKGIRSIQSITLGTSLLTGAVSLMLYRALLSRPLLNANVGGTLNNKSDIKIYNGSCIHAVILSNGTTATTLTGSLELVNK